MARKKVVIRKNIIVRIVIVIIENECPLLANVGAGLARPYAPTWMFFGQADPAPTSYWVKCGYSFL